MYESMLGGWVLVNKIKLQKKLCMSLFGSGTSFIPFPLLLAVTFLRFNYFHKVPIKGPLIKLVPFQSLSNIHYTQLISKYPSESLPRKIIIYYFLYKYRMAFGVLNLKVNLERESQIPANFLKALFIPES